MDAVTMETVAGRIPACEHTNFPPIRGNANLSNLLSSPLLSSPLRGFLSDPSSESLGRMSAN